MKHKKNEAKERLYDDYLHGRVLTPDGLRLIVQAYNFDKEEIGQHFVQMYAHLISEGRIKP